MDNNEIRTKLYDIFDEFFELDESDFTPELTADEVGGWDSLNHIRLMLQVQQAFGVNFTTGEIGDLMNVGELIALVGAKAE